MLKRLVRASLFCAICLSGAAASATPIEFTPPNDGIGAEYSAANDSWWMGRGITFGVTSRQAVSSVGLWHDLSGVDLNFSLYEISTSAVTLTRLTLLAGGGSTVDTDGRAWIDYELGGLVLDPGKEYLLEFAFQGEANSNFYYDNQNMLWTQGAFTGLDGTLGNELGNFVVAALRIDAEAVAAEVPEPGSLLLTAVGLAALVRRRRRALIG